MMRGAIAAAGATGGFCAVFALGVDALTDALNWMQVMVISFLSGFLGSLFAHFVLGKAPKGSERREG